MLRANTTNCPRCGSPNLIIDQEAGEEVCSECGLVVEEDIIDTGPEWRAFTKSEKALRPRVGMARSYTLYDMGLTTSFNGNRDARGNRLDSNTRSKMNKLKRYDTRSKLDDTWGRNLSIAMAELDRLSALLHIPKAVKEHAALIYRQTLKEDLIRGRSIDAFVAASLYAACRKNRIPRPLKEISKASTREHSEVSRSYRLLQKELKLKMPIDDPMKFVSGIASKLKIKQDTEHHAIEILRKARERYGLSGKDPRGIAAAALYMACMENDDKRIQKDVAAAAGTTEVTLRNRLKGLESVLQEPGPMVDETIISAQTQ
ncbi:MAG: transcription initiation factor IIB [Candidatus Bathyarchaeota archaeon]|nr:MAG: transcription initiation factor IIB [Candidatus Bathyarchaeota archaeon]